MTGNDFMKDFPVLTQKTGNGKRLAYLDSAATSQKPVSVIEAVEKYYKVNNANPHRGSYELSMKSTDIYENAREKVKEFLGAESSKNIIFTKNATEAFNLLASSYGMDFVNAGDEIVISIAEHHSNLIPWQRVAKVKNASLKYMYINEDTQLTMEEVKEKITDKTKVVSITHVSNALGTINDIKSIIDYAHSKNAVVIVDGSQSVPHMKVDVSELDADFMVFSGHKMLAPMGIGVLYGKLDLLHKMSPYIYGGDMVEYVYEQDATFDAVPFKFEGGTQNVEGAAGLMAAIEYLENIGMDNVHAIEKELVKYTYEKLSELPYVKIYGTSDVDKRCGIISFNIDGVHPHDAASILDSHGVAVRSGNHCAQPLFRFMGENSVCRASFYFYNTKEDADQLIEAVKAAYAMFEKWR